MLLRLRLRYMLIEIIQNVGWWKKWHNRLIYAKKPFNSTKAAKAKSFNYFFTTYYIIWTRVFEQCFWRCRLILLSSVFRSVTDPRDGKRVALKKMPSVFQNMVSCKRVYRELRMLCQFKHDNVSVITADETNSWIYFLPSVYKHWTDTREFITWTVELWNRWIRLSCYYNRV